jgi:hypothetical protein
LIETRHCYILIWRFSVNKSWLMVVSLVLLIAGLFVVLRSVTWGSEAANAYLQSQGGGMDTSQFMIVLQEHIENYRWVGNILAFIGGLGLVKTIEVK